MSDQQSRLAKQQNSFSHKHSEPQINSASLPVLAGMKDADNTSLKLDLSDEVMQKLRLMA